MTIPLDNLYHYIDGLFPEPVCVYLFYPHGSRNILDLTGVKPFNRLGYNLDSGLFPLVVCNDQEPLNYEFYENLEDEILNRCKERYKGSSSSTTNFKAALAPFNIYDNMMLLHSEKNSADLKLYQDNGYVDAYYWCHAFIARDWYRFAEHDVRLISNTVPTKDFLIYCRDWSGSREYRIKFQELLYNKNLVKNSITSVMKKNSNGICLEHAVFKNKSFEPKNKKFFYNLLDNDILPSDSANYCPDDFNNSYISVVLETIFDGSKIHLTEKILRPIACGHPFILAAGPGSLEYLRSYGFKTFDPWIDESYDQETNSVCRLQKIVDAMHKFSTLTTTDKGCVVDQLKKIADYNKRWFFSKDFTDLIDQELKTNIDIAFKKVKKSRAVGYRSREKNHNIKHLHADSRNIRAVYLNNLRKLNPPGR